jgi:hypothetical protein
VTCDYALQLEAAINKEVRREAAFSREEIEAMLAVLVSDNKLFVAEGTVYR